MVKNIQHYLDGCVAWILSFQVDEHGAGVIHSFHGLAYVGIENSRVAHGKTAAAVNEIVTCDLRAENIRSI